MHMSKLDADGRLSMMCSLSTRASIGQNKSKTRGLLNYAHLFMIALYHLDALPFAAYIGSLEADVLMCDTKWMQIGNIIQCCFTCYTQKAPL